MANRLKNLEVEEISILGKNSRPAVAGARVRLLKSEDAGDDDAAKAAAAKAAAAKVEKEVKPMPKILECLQEIQKNAQSGPVARLTAIAKAIEEAPDDLSELQEQAAEGVRKARDDAMALRREVDRSFDELVAKTAADEKCSRDIAHSRVGSRYPEFVELYNAV